MKQFLHLLKLKPVLSGLLLSLVSAVYANSGDVVFQEDFADTTAFKKWTIVDNNGGRSWEFLNGAASYMLDYKTDLPADDWIISPKFLLDETKVYELSFSLGIASKTENLRVALGTSTDPKTFTKVLADYPNVVHSDSGDKEIKFYIQGSGGFRLGFYAYSEANMHRIDIDNVKITEVSSKVVPGLVTNLEAAPGNNGDMKSSISFNAPKITAGDDVLTDLTGVDIYREGTDTPVKTFSGVNPGEALSWTDDAPIHGFNTYKVVARNTAGAGAEVDKKIFVGLDQPLAVTGLMAKLNKDRSITLTWTAPTASINGGYVDYTHIKYKITRNGTSIVEAFDGLSYIDKAPAYNGQVALSYAVIPIAATETGGSAESDTIVTGLPLQLSYKESFAGQKMATPWTTDNSVKDFNWHMMGDDEDGENEGVMTQDHDNGMIMAESKTANSGTSSRFVSPLIDLSSAKNPVLTFWFYHARSQWYDPEADGTINDNVKVQISYDAGVWQDVENSTSYLNNDSTGWTKCQVHLPKQASSFVNIGILATAESDISAYRNIYIDNISISEASYSNDLSVDSFSVDKKRVNVGETSTYKVSIFNGGASQVSDYKVDFYCDGKLMGEKDGPAVDPSSKQEVEYQHQATLDDAQADEHSWYAEIVYATDEATENNQSEKISTSVRKPDVPVVTLSGTSDGSNVSLSWSEAKDVAAIPHAADLVSVTDDFESYTPFIIDNIGDWTVLDKDTATTLVTPRIPVAYLNQGKRMAFQVFNVVDAGVWVDANKDDAFEPHSGNQYMACPSANGTAENDDWLITPRLDGRAQTISFYAKAATYDAEWMNVYGSKTDKNSDSFEKINKEDQIYVHEGWTKYSYDVPEGTKYFAVRCVRRCVFLFLDDFTYNKYDGSTDGLTFKGYNVYRDGKKINTDLLTSNSYVDHSIATGSQHAYTVTAVYAEGESDYSNKVDLVVTDINAVENNKAKITVSQDLLSVSVASPSDIVIYDLGGRVIYQAIAATSANVILKGGTYIVRVGKERRKILIL
jgi:hypothetical protein